MTGSGWRCNSSPAPTIAMSTRVSPWRRKNSVNGMNRCPRMMFAPDEICQLVDIRQAGRRGSREFVQRDILVLDAQILEHLDDGGVHHGWTAHVKLAVLRRRMVLQIVFIDHVVDEAGLAGPVVFRLRIGQRDVPLEIIVLGGQLVVVLLVEHLLETAGTVPETDLALG